MIRDHRYRVELVKIELIPDTTVKQKQFKVFNKNNSINFTTSESNIRKLKISDSAFYYGRVIGSTFELIMGSSERF